jgi:uncharacterized protein YlxP (DUF503 family)
MTIGLLTVVIFIQDSNSLKEKRMVLHSFKKRLSNSFNVAISQIADEDKWQKATLAIVGVERERKNMDSLLSKVINFIEDFPGIDIINHQMELL